MTTYKRYILSSLTTFLTVFISTVAIQISSGTVMLSSGAFWLAVVAVGLRAGVKAIIESLVGQNADPVATV